MIEPGTLAAVLVEHLPEHLARQRWSGAHDREITSLSLAWLELPEPDEPLLAWTLVEATFADGGAHAYQLFVGGRRANQLPDFLQGKERELIAVVPDPGGEIVLYDALVDPDLAIAVLHLAAPEIEVEVRRPLVLEHSNSSIVFDEARILKIFRKVEPGSNPDVEITRVLSESGYDQVLPPLAELRRDGTDLAVLREFLVGATEGWQLARTSVRDVLASRLAPEECGGDFAPDAERLGATIAGLHVAMAAAWGTAAGDADRWVSEMLDHLEEVAVGEAASIEPSTFDPATVRRHLETVRAQVDVGRELRIHGDLHLAQVIQVDAGWVVLDFEGEPARIPVGRFTSSSPLRDVAGMLRSLHYAAASGLAEWDEGDPELLDLLVSWEERSRSAFLDGYLGQEAVADLLPAAAPDRTALLAAFELDKAVYELGYELGHRPDQVAIPLEGIARIINRQATA